MSNVWRCEIGARVNARYGGGVSAFAGEIAMIHDDGTLDIAYDDGDSEQHVARALVAPWKPLHKGDTVRARYGGGKVAFPGCIVRVHENGKFDIAYDDGDAEGGVSPRLVELVVPGGAKGGGGGGVQPLDEGSDEGSDIGSDAESMPEPRAELGPEPEPGQDSGPGRAAGAPAPEPEAGNTFTFDDDLSVSGSEGEGEESGDTQLVWEAVQAACSGIELDASQGDSFTFDDDVDVPAHPRSEDGSAAGGGSRSDSSAGDDAERLEVDEQFRRLRSARFGGGGGGPAPQKCAHFTEEGREGSREERRAAARTQGGGGGDDEGEKAKEDEACEEQEEQEQNVLDLSGWLAPRVAQPLTSAAGLEQLLEENGASELELAQAVELRLARRGVADMGFLGAFELDALQTLDLSGNELGRWAGRALARDGGGGAEGEDGGRDGVGGAGLRRIAVLDLSRNGIRRLAPSRLGEFARLQELRLCDNQLRGLSGVEVCRALRVLDVSRNRMERLLALRSAPY
eukprot:g2965.t1